MIVCVVVGGVISNGAQHIRVELRCAIALRSEKKFHGDNMPNTVP